VSTPEAQPQPSRLRGLDGLRAIAVIAVLLYHLEVFPWVARGGYLGVDLFFVISGFLITGLLAAEWERKKTGYLGMLLKFYWRRIKRLIPAAWLLIAACVFAAWWLAPDDALPRLHEDALAALLYLINYQFIWHGVSYFEATGRQPLLLHLWSLAIEGQFYLVWGPVLLLGLARVGRRGMGVIALMLAVASVAWMKFMALQIGYAPGGTVDATRLYFGTDTHGFQLLFGAALGLWWQPGKHAAAATHGAGKIWLALAGLAALVLMLQLMFMLDEQTPWLYPWGFLLSAVISMALIALATHPGSSFGLWLDNRVMRWIGERSYGIYLWHWPIYMLIRPGVDLPSWPPVLVALSNVTLAVVMAALSYKFVEAPINHGWLERLWRELRSPEWGAALWRGVLAGASALLIFESAAIILLRAPDHITPAADVTAAINGSIAHGEGDDSTTPNPTAPPPLPISPGDANDAVAKASFPGNDLLALGDSVLLGSSYRLLRKFPAADVHATVGWQAADVLNQLETLSHDGQLRSKMLLHLGDNGYLTEKQLRQMLDLLAGTKRVLLVNSHVPRRWMVANNDLIDRVAPDYPNVVVVDWRAASSGHRDYFVSDGVHLTLKGQRVFIDAIVSAGYPELAAEMNVAPRAGKNVAAGKHDVCDDCDKHNEPAPVINPAPTVASPSGCASASGCDGE
jgi:peptidoglycan/LPS O-acetylase OafA/YrhL